MRPRDFCREPGYDKALLITYDFDALFFERIVLPDLWAGGSTDIQVLADLRQVNQALPRWVGQVRQLGQRYQLTCATVPGAFHPKIIIRSGSSGGAVWIGSGNVTHGGWGCNLEVGAAWRLGAGEGDRGGWVRDLLSHIVTWLPAAAGDAVYHRVLDSPWLATTNDGSAQSPVIVAQKGLSLAQQLSDRWRGRRFEQATIVTGSSDERGSVLRWFHDQFGVSRATVLVDPTMASFKSEQLNRLPLAIDLVALKVPRTVHAKFYWLDGPGGPAAVMGSANCSTSAWLLSPDGGGNVEAVAVYDQPLRDDFADLLRCVAVDETNPANITDAPENDVKDAATGPEYAVAAVSWERLIQEVKLVFAKPLPAGSSVLIQVEDERVPCHHHDANTLWWAHLAADSFCGRGTVFAEVFIRTADGWDLPAQHVFINDIAELRNAARGRGMADSVKSLGRPHSTSEYQKILLELQKIGIALLNDDSLFPDPLSVRKKAQQQEPAKREDSAPAVDPEQLIRSLEGVGSSQHDVRTASPLKGLTLNGIIRALFELEDDNLEIFQGEEEYEDPADPPASNDPRTPPSPPIPPQPPTTQAPPNTTKAKLRKEMDGYLKRLGDPSFAAKCSASQLQQAAAYPLAVAANGLVGGWIDATVGQEWTTRVFDTLFCAHLPGAGDGLIEAVKRRYEARAEGEAFRKIIGDGTLWAAMLASLRKAVWGSRNGEIKKALALRAVLFSKDLLASAEPGRMAALIGNVERRSRLEGSLAAAKDATRILTDLEHYIVRHWDQLTGEQSQAAPPREPDDALFSQKGGWAFFVRETEPLEAAKIIVYLQRKATEVKVSLTAVQYLNVTKATGLRPDLRALVDGLKRF